MKNIFFSKKMVAATLAAGSLTFLVACTNNTQKPATLPTDQVVSVIPQPGTADSPRSVDVPVGKTMLITTSAKPDKVKITQNPEGFIQINSPSKPTKELINSLVSVTAIKEGTTTLDFEDNGQKTFLIVHIVKPK